MRLFCNACELHLSDAKYVFMLSVAQEASFGEAMERVKNAFGVGICRSACDDQNRGFVYL